MARELGENMSDEELQEMIREADKAWWRSSLLGAPPGRTSGEMRGGRDDFLRRVGRIRDVGRALAGAPSKNIRLCTKQQYSPVHWKWTMLELSLIHI